MRGLAEAADVSNPYLSQIERGLRKPSAEILQQLARALSVSVESLYVKAGILDDRRASVDVVAEIGRDRHLTADQRDALVVVYRSMRAAVGVPLDGDEPDPVPDAGPDRGAGHRPYRESSAEERR